MICKTLLVYKNLELNGSDKIDLPTNAILIDQSHLCQHSMAEISRGSVGSRQPHVIYSLLPVLEEVNMGTGKNSSRSR